MTRIELAPEVIGDLGRIVDHLREHDARDSALRIAGIIQTIEVLEHSPMIGRQVEGARRELVIGRDAKGYVALYRYVPELDTVFVLAIRSQREGGYDC